MIPTLPTTDPSLETDARDLHRVLEDLLRVVQFRDRDRICCHDISVTQCWALEALARSGPSTLNVLAEALYLDKSTASRVASALERKGYLTRSTNPEDGRSVLLGLTKSGEQLFLRIEEELEAEVAAVAREFEPEVRRSMVRLLGRLATAASGRVERSAGCCRLR